MALSLNRMGILSGIPLFGNEGIEQPLDLIDVSVSDNGTIQKRYRMKSAVRLNIPKSSNRCNSIISEGWN